MGRPNLSIILFGCNSTKLKESNKRPAASLSRAETISVPYVQLRRSPFVAQEGAKVLGPERYRKAGQHDEAAPDVIVRPELLVGYQRRPQRGPYALGGDDDCRFARPYPAEGGKLHYPYEGSRPAYM